MPAKVKVRILAGRNLPVMDKSSDASDAFVEVKLGNTTYKTEVYRRSLNPFWNSEWFRFEVSDQELQDEPLQIRIMDYDTYSANDAIGKVYINLNPLLINPGRSMSGWLPIYDTLHGIRGEINCMVKVNLFADNNRYRHSSCGVRFFFSDIPNGYKCDAILGFVDELLVNDDPEYQWIDKIRTPRASNEARQTLFTKLSGEVQRKLGLKAEIFGGNAVIGYQQSFDLEGGSGIVGRGIGTAVILSKIGFPYEGIISPLHLNSERNPYPCNTNARMSNVQPYIRSSKSHHQSFITHKNNPYPDRHLVHSVSADYFYEVPSKGVPNKKLSAVLDSSKLSKLLTIHRFVPGKTGNVCSDDDDSDDYNSDDGKNEHNHDGDEGESDYEDCEETIVESSNTNESLQLTKKSSYLDGLESSLKVSNTTATVGSRLHSIRTIKNFSSLTNKPLSFLSSSKIDTKDSYRRTSKPRLNTTALINKLRQKNEIISQKLATVANPFTANKSVGLTKLLSFRKYQQQQSNLISQHRHASSDRQSTTTVADDDQQLCMDSMEQSTSTSSSAHNASRDLKRSLTASSSNNSTSGSVSANVLPAISGPAIYKHRRDKSQSTSIDDALSNIIEERPDDVDDRHHMQVTRSATNPPDDQSSRPRLLSNSSGRQKHAMVRATEIDDDNELAGTDRQRSKGFSLSSTDYDDLDENALSSLASLDPTRGLSGESGKVTATTSSDWTVLSSSSPSGSALTDETVKAVRSRTTSPRLTTQISSPVAHAPYATLRRSDTDIAHSQLLAKSNMDSTQKPPLAYQDREAKRASPDCKQSSSLQKLHCGGANFVQSVKIVKAQQHLLQNMIRHHNQNLLTSSSLKAKNAFIYPNRVHQSEYPFVTLKKYPENMIQCTGGVVSVHSVKLLDHIINDEESETRDIWWTEIRKEIRSHAKALNCNTILGYSETSKVLGDVCVLSACGTAAILKPIESNSHSTINTGNDTYGHSHHQNSPSSNYNTQTQTLKVPRLSASPPPSHSSMPSGQPQTEIDSNLASNHLADASSAIAPESTGMEESQQYPSMAAASSRAVSMCGEQSQGEKIDCTFCHTPLVCVESIGSLASCRICKASKVPDVLLLTIEPPQNLNIVSTGTLVQARVCRAKRDSHGEASAKEIGDALPFLEYELHRQLFSKLKFKGMNCLFNLSVDISIGDNMLTGIATGTGCFVLGLPTPEAPQISAGKGIKTSKLSEIQRLIALSALKNRENLGLKFIDDQLTLYHEQVCNIVSNADSNHRTTGVSSINEANLIAPSNTPTNQQQQRHGSQDLDSASLSRSTNLLGGGGGGGANLNTSPLSQESSFELSLSGDNSSDRRSAAGNSRPQARATDSTSSSQLANLQHYRQQNKHQHHRHHHHHHQQQQQQQNTHQQLGSKRRTGGGSTHAPATNLLSGESNIVLEVDDNEDADIIALLIDSDVPEGYLICNSESIPTINQSSITSINMFTQVTRAKLIGLDQFAQQFDWILQAIFVKLRRSLPCCLTNMNFVVDLPESHIVQISVTGCLLGLRSNSSPSACDHPDSMQGQFCTSDALIASNCDDARTLGNAQTGTSHPKGAQKSSKLASSSSTSMSPSSTSSGSTSSSASPSSSASTRRSSSSSVNSVKEAVSTATLTTAQTAAAAAKSLTKQLSKTNIAALLSGKTLGDKKKMAKVVGNVEAQTMELKQVPEVKGAPTGDEQPQASTKATIAAVKQEIEQNRLGGSDSPKLLQRQQQTQRTTNSGNLLRPVFKKQQTYPGAYSPAISGHDRLLPMSGNDVAPNTSSGAGSNAARRATIILNKVKQPLKDLGSNFNASTSNQPQQSPGDQVDSSKSFLTGKSSARLASAPSATPTGGGGGSMAGGSIFAPPIAASAASPAAGIAPVTNSNGVTPSLLSSHPKAGERTLNSSIDITSLSYIPGAKEYHYLGNLSFSFVRESSSVRENGGLNGFIHCFLMEVYAIVRAHVSALGGNALLSFRLQQSCIFYHSNKNQAQCLISVAGDAVQVSL